MPLAFEFISRHFEDQAPQRGAHIVPGFGPDAAAATFPPQQLVAGTWALPQRKAGCGSSPEDVACKLDVAAKTVFRLPRCLSLERGDGLARYRQNPIHPTGSLHWFNTIDTGLCLPVSRL